MWGAELRYATLSYLEEEHKKHGGGEWVSTICFLFFPHNTTVLTPDKNFTKGPKAARLSTIEPIKPYGTDNGSTLPLHRDGHAPARSYGLCLSLGRNEQSTRFIPLVPEFGTFCGTRLPG